MTAKAVLSELRRRGIELVAAGDRLRYRPVAAVDERLRTELAEHKGELLAALRGESGRYEVPDGWTRESWVRRLHYLAGVCIHPARAAELREWADGLEKGA